MSEMLKVIMHLRLEPLLVSESYTANGILFEMLEIGKSPSNSNLHSKIIYQILKWDTPVSVVIQC